MRISGGNLENTALNHYIGKDGLQRRNCAQAILCAFQETLDIQDDVIEKYSEFGTGRAPENKCGAIFAAEYVLELTDHVDQIQPLLNLFESEAGSVKCREIRHAKKMSCLGCVQNSARFLSEVILDERDLAENEEAI